jgi:hypothetical protein
VKSDESSLASSLPNGVKEMRRRIPSFNSLLDVGAQGLMGSATAKLLANELPEGMTNVVAQSDDRDVAKRATICHWTERTGVLQSITRGVLPNECENDRAALLWPFNTTGPQESFIAAHAASQAASCTMSPFILQPRSAYLRERITRTNGVRTRAATTMTAVTVSPNRDDPLASEEDHFSGLKCSHSLPEIASERVLLSARPHSSLPNASIEDSHVPFFGQTELCKASPPLKPLHVDLATFRDSTCYLNQGQCNDSLEGWFVPSKSNLLQVDCDQTIRSAGGHPRKILLPEL